MISLQDTKAFTTTITKIEYMTKIEVPCASKFYQENENTIYRIGASNHKPFI